MNTSILIASYHKDIPYLEWCLKSIQKFATGFKKVVVVVPAIEWGTFTRALLPGSPGLRMYERTADAAKWQLHAQVQKCLGDVYCSDTDYVLHLDSDCIFTEPVTPEDYFVNGKPVMLIESFTRLPGSPWKAVTERALGFTVGYETMRRHPQVNPIGIYRAMRDHIENHHRMGFATYVLSQPGGFPFGFSEHCAIGAFALSQPKWHDAYHWIEVGKDAVPKEKVKQFWSHSPPGQPQGTPHDKDTVTPLQVCQRLIG